MSDTEEGSHRNIHWWAAWVGVIGVIFGGAELCVQLRDPPASAQVLVDEAVVGSWEIDVQASHWIQTIRSDGTISFAATGPGSPPPWDGTIRASDGTWSVSVPALNWVDGGSYRLPDDDTLELQGKLGTGLWTRKP